MTAAVATGPPPTGARSPSSARGPAQDSAVALASVALVLLGFDRELAHGVTLGLLVVLALLPVWAGSLRAHLGAPVLVALTFVALASGIVLTQTAGRETASRNAVEMSLRLVAATGGVGLVLWARQVVPLRHVALCYALGALAAGVLASPGSLNPWKYQLASATTVLVLALALHARSRRRQLLWAVAALTAMGAISITHDYRSHFGMCVLAIPLVLWQSSRRQASRRRGKVSTAVLLVALAATAYYLGTALLVSGHLGAQLQQRSIAQVESSGSLLTGGRPEWAATVQLMRDHPSGYGVGAVPLPSDVETAYVGLVPEGLLPGNGYVEHFMFGGQFKLHSIVADLWSNFGVLGLVLALWIILLLADALVTSVSAREPSPLLAFLVLLALWDMAFGPIFSNLPEVALALGVALRQRPKSAARRQRGARPALP